MHSAQLDLNNKLAAQQDADSKHAADQAAVDTAKAQLANFQSAVDKFAALRSTWAAEPTAWTPC